MEIRTETMTLMANEAYFDQDTGEIEALGLSASSQIRSSPAVALHWFTSARTANAVAINGSSSFTRFSEFTQLPSRRWVRFRASATEVSMRFPRAWKASVDEAA